MERCALTGALEQQKELLRMQRKMFEEREEKNAMQRALYEQSQKADVERRRQQVAIPPPSFASFKSMSLSVYVCMYVCMYMCYETASRQRNVART
jgi:hypothetical protein